MCADRQVVESSSPSPAHRSTASRQLARAHWSGESLTGSAASSPQRGHSLFDNASSNGDEALTEADGEMEGEGLDLATGDHTDAISIQPAYESGSSSEHVEPSNMHEFLEQG